MNAIRVIATIKAESRFGSEGMSLLRLRGLSIGKVPRWFRQITDRDFAGRFNAHWFDHPARNGDALVVEPYDLDDESLRDLLAFAIHCEIIIRTEREGDTPPRHGQFRIELSRTLE